eukprot:tig00001428_g8727.t1
MARSTALLALLLVCVASLAAAKTDEVTVNFFRDDQCTHRLALGLIPRMTLTFDDHECYTPDDAPATHAGPVTLPPEKGLLSAPYPGGGVVIDIIDRCDAEFPEGSGSVKLACSNDGAFVECTKLMDQGKTRVPNDCEDASKGPMRAYFRIKCAVKPNEAAADGMESNAVKAARVFFSRFF